MTLPNLRSRLLALCQTARARLQGSYIGRREEFLPLSSRAPFPVDQALLERLEAARVVMLANGSNVDKAKRRMIVETDTFVAPRPFDDEGLF